MEMEFSILTGLLVIGTDLLTRAAVQGIAPALLSTVIEYGLKRIRLGLTFVPNYTRLRR
jgi:hypothetical protein